MKDIKKILAFLQGLSICNNVIYFFNYNTFYLNVSYIISIVTLLYIIFKEKGKITNCLNRIDKIFYLYIFFCLLSIIPMFFYFKNDLSITSAFFNGLPGLILIFIQYLVIVALCDNRKQIINGIVSGFIINIIFSILQYIFYYSGNIFTLYRLFPNPSFQVAGNYFVLESMPDIASTLKIYSFRAQGLFLETSYFLIFVIGSILIVLNNIKNNIIKVVILFVTIWLCAISESGNFIILIFILILYLIAKLICSHKDKRKISRKMLLIFPIILLVGMISIPLIANNEKLIANIQNSILSIDTSDSNNIERTTSIKRGAELIMKYPFGIGYNMSSTIYGKEYGSEYVNAIFSTLIVNELEIGLVGNLMYIIFSIKMILNAFKSSKDKTNIALSISALGLLLCQVTNGISYWRMPYIIFIFALINASLTNKKIKEQ